MHILNAMSAVTRLRIDKPILTPKFYPIPFEKYITLQGDSKFESRKYSWFGEVIALLRPSLDSVGIKVVQIGGREDQPVLGVDSNLCGKTTYRQTYDIINRSLLHVGVDSLNIHIASVFNKKIVGLYSNMYISHSKPYWSDPEDIRLIQAPLVNRKPSYSTNDNPKVINLIKPEIIANAVLELLGLISTIDRQSLYFGDKYSASFLESVPDCVIDPNFNPQLPLHIRYDWVAENEVTKSFLYNQLRIRKNNIIITDKRLDINLLRQCKPNILQVIFNISNKEQVEFVKEVVSLGLPYALISDLPEQEVQELKLTYLDYNPIKVNNYPTREKVDPNGLLTENSQFKTSKLLLSQNKIFASKAHWLLDKHSPQPFQHETFGEFINNKEFWREIEFYYLFNTTNPS